MENIARKERRRLEQTKRFRKAKRGAAIVGTAMVGCSVAAPLVQPVPVQADETPVQFSARINTAAFRHLSQKLLLMLNQSLKPTIYMHQ